MSELENLQEIIETLNAQYGLKTELLEKVKQGYLSHNYILGAGRQRYFLKQYRFEDIERIKEIHRVKFFFREGGIPVILPLKDINNNSILSVGNVHYALFPFVKGKTIERDVISKIPLISMGETLADIHLLSKQGYPSIVSKQHKPLNTEEFLENAELMLKKIDGKNEKESFDRLALKNLRLKIDLANKMTNHFSRFNLKNDHIIHGDYHNRNVFFDDSDQVKYVYDEEKTGLAPRVFELVRSMTFSCFDGEYTKQEKYENALSYVKAYHQKYPLKKGEITEGIIYHHTRKFHSLWIENEHYVKNSRRVDHFLPKEHSRLLYFSQNIDKFSALFERVLF